MTTPRANVRELAAPAASAVHEHRRQEIIDREGLGPHPKVLRPPHGGKGDAAAITAGQGSRRS